MKISTIAAIVGILWATALHPCAAQVGSKDFKSAHLFQTTNLWTVHFQFTLEQWEAMEPKGGAGGFAGMFGGGGFGGRGGRGGPGGFRMPEGFGVGLFLAPGFLRAGDLDQDNQLSKVEFLALGEKWFADWDTNKTGRLSTDQVRTELNSALGQGNFGFPGMGGMGRRGFPPGADGRGNGLAAMMGVEFKYVHAELEFQGARFKDIAVRYKGNSTFMMAGPLKRSLKVDLNKFVKGQKLAGLSKLNFANAVTDPSWMNEVLSHRLFRDAGVPAPRTAYAKVFVTVPGKFDKQYFGLYSIVEEVDNNFADERFDSKKGAIFKPATRSPLFVDLGDDWKNYDKPYGPKTELTLEQKQRVIEFCKFVSKADDSEFAAKLGDFLDLDQCARFMAVTVYLSSMDSILGMGQNYYVYLHPKARKFQFLPWDQDLSFGHFPMQGGQPENFSIHRPWQGEIRFLERLFKVEAFKKLYLAKLDEFSKTILQPERFHQQVDEIAPVIRPAVQEESEQKLAQFDKVVAGEIATSGVFAGFGQAAKPIKPFVKLRTQSIIDQLAGKSEGQPPGVGFAFGGFGGPGGFGRRGGGPGGFGGGGGPGGFGPGTFLGTSFMNALDSDKDDGLSRDEFARGFAKWFDQWDTDKSGVLTEERLRAGLNKDLPLFPGGAGFGFPGGDPSRER